MDLYQVRKTGSYLPVSKYELLSTWNTDLHLCFSCPASVPCKSWHAGFHFPFKLLFCNTYRYGCSVDYSARLQHQWCSFCDASEFACSSLIYCSTCFLNTLLFPFLMADYLAATIVSAWPLACRLELLLPVWPRDTWPGWTHGCFLDVVYPLPILL